MSMFARALTHVAPIPRDISSSDSSLAPAMVRRGLKLSLIEGMLAQVHISLTTGAFLTGFMLLLGADNTTIGVVAALPFLIQPLQLLGAWLVERLGTRKGLTVGGSLGRTVWLVIVLLPYLPLGAPQRLTLLIVTLFVSGGLLTICSNAWLHWMTDLVPPRLRGRYFGTRSTAMALVAMVANAAGGWWLDHMRAAHTAAHGYTVLFTIGVICAGIGTLLLTRQPEPPMTERTRLPFVDVLRIPWQLASFRRFLGAMIMWHIALGVAAPFFSAHALQVLGIPFTKLAMLDVITAAVSLLTLPLWGRVSDRFGQRRVLIICMTGAIVLPLAWVVATPTMLWPLYLNAVISGIWWPGITLAQANRLMEQTPGAARGAYLALFAATTGLAYFLASTLAGSVADALAQVQWSLGSASINNYQTLFLVASALRASVALGWRKAL